MDYKELGDAVRSASRLQDLLNEEFEALKGQNLDQFEKVQKEKVEIIHTLSTFSPKKNTKNNDLANPDDSAWDDFMQIMASCKNLHMRNEILINRKLDATKGALHALQSQEPTSSVEVYDRLGKLSRGGKRGGYEVV